VKIKYLRSPEAHLAINKVNSEIITKAQSVLDIESEAILKIRNSLNDDFEKAINLLYECKGRVVVSGMGKSGLVGRKISATFSSTGTPSFFMHPAEGSHGDSGAVMKNDIVLAISNSGETEELLQILPLVKRLGIQLISMTSNKESTLAKKSNVILDITVDKEACPLGLAPTASTTATLALGDAMAVVLLDKRGFTPEDFLMFHPSGRLGRSLIWTVEEIMTSGDNIPVVKETDTFHASLYVISEKGLGVAVVVDENNKMKGILTDGDIRRALNRTPDTSQIIVKDVMTVNPKTIEKEALAAAALQIMEQYSITALVVLNTNEEPVGVLHIHHLLKAGVA
jgi:arabinose-5-phosphate isomerase